MEYFKSTQLRQVYGIRRSSFLCCFLIIFYAMYLITGAFMFAALESPLERRDQNVVKEKLTQFLMKHSCISSTLLLFYRRVAGGYECWIFNWQIC